MKHSFSHADANLVLAVAEVVKVVVRLVVVIIAVASLSAR